MNGAPAAQGLGEFSQLLFGVCAGALLAMAGATLRAARPTARWSGFAFFLCPALFAIRLWNDQVRAIPSEVAILIGITAMTSVGWFWLARWSSSIPAKPCSGRRRRQPHCA